MFDLTIMCDMKNHFKFPTVAMSENIIAGVHQ